MVMVCGFMFSNKAQKDNERNVALIRKLKPGWQKGNLNGIGGKVETGETPHNAMIREFKEEAGVKCTKWAEFCTLRVSGHVVHFYKTRGDLSLLKSMEKEQIEIIHTSMLAQYAIIPNLQWLIPMALHDSDVYEIFQTDG